MGDDCVPCPLLREVEYLSEIYLWVVSVMGRLAVSVNVRPSAHLTLFDMCARENVNGDAPHLQWNARKNESE